MRDLEGGKQGSEKERENAREREKAMRQGWGHPFMLCLSSKRPVHRTAYLRVPRGRHSTPGIHLLYSATSHPSHSSHSSQGE